MMITGNIIFVLRFLKTLFFNLLCFIGFITISFYVFFCKVQSFKYTVIDIVTFCVEDDSVQKDLKIYKKNRIISKIEENKKMLENIKFLESKNENKNDSKYEEKLKELEKKILEAKEKSLLLQKHLSEMETEK